MSAPTETGMRAIRIQVSRSQVPGWLRIDVPGLLAAVAMLAVVLIAAVAALLMLLVAR